MRAVVIKSGCIEVADVPAPVPSEGEVLIDVALAGICGTDLEILRGYANFEGIPGHEFVGTVATGPKELTGKRVVAEINCVCGRCPMCTGGLANHCVRRTVVGIVGRPGAFAEQVAVPQRNCHVIPESVSDEDAVFVEPLAAAIQITQQLRMEPKQNVAVIGSGRLGLLVAQVVAKTGANLVVLGRNPNTLGFLDRKGIRTATLEQWKQSADQHVVIDCTGSAEGLQAALRLVRPRGTVVMKSTVAGKVEVDLTPLVVNEITVLGSRCGPFDEALSMLARRDVDVAGLITARMPLAEAVGAFEASAQPDHIKVLLTIGS